MLFLVALVAFVALGRDAITRIAGRTAAEFTGRSAIWAAELRYIADHPLLGAGFGTFTDTRSQSPLHNYVSGSWVDAVSTAITGYQQVLVTIGGIGFGLMVLAVLLNPHAPLLALDWDARGFRPMLFAFVHFRGAAQFHGKAISWRGTASPGRCC